MAQAKKQKFFSRSRHFAWRTARGLLFGFAAVILILLLVSAATVIYYFRTLPNYDQIAQLNAPE